VALGLPASTPFAGLLSLAACGGCAAKAPPDVVALLANVAAGTGGHPDALVGLTPADDAAVWRLDEHRAMVATVDFFPPVVDDPADYGAIAAANAISDVYAMGGELAFALALSGFPDEVPPATIEAVARAAAAVVAECGGLVVGGHSVRCREPVFGLCAFGFVHPDRIWRKAGARPGDALVLSKPLGTGVLVSSRRPDAARVATASMRTTNRRAAAALRAASRAPSAVTDVTGFGLAGHAAEMAAASGVELVIDTRHVPLLAGALEVAAAGVRTSAHRRSTPHAVAAVAFAPEVAADRQALMRDPQTSGGLLAAVAPEDVASLRDAGFVVVGEVRAGRPAVTFTG
jgi:selenide,water dikinase